MKRSDWTCYLLVIAAGIGFGIFTLAVTAAKDSGGQTATITSSLQDATKPSDAKQDNTKAKHLPMKAVSMSGKVSNDGKTFINDKGNHTWTVSNPDALKGHEGHQVKVKGHLDTANNEIHVTSVKMRSSFSGVPEQP
jgi:hypothetical protein